MDYIQVIVLSLIQGITEFLPVSSSGHLILPAQLLGWPDQGLVFDVAVHLGTLLAVVVYFRKDLVKLIHDWCYSFIGKGSTENSKLAWYLIFSTLPAVFFGLILKKTGLDESMRSVAVITATTLIFGLLLGWADLKSKRVIPLDKITLKQALIIGFTQAIALIPGTSRSGITMTAALMLGFTRDAAARFSFLLSIPVIIGAGSLMITELATTTATINWLLLATGTAIAGISAWLCVYFFMAFINRVGLLPFVVYRLLLGLVLLFLL
ncbi:Undecaprenyl-diphosphatase [invertebrate metagenome]|uniref:Undecaprenyl-diphosphatase n=1 Tax=invertebrate metagenome TaxID=1711999 RepID=A0A2H9TAH4_9ZZZZ